MAGYHPQPEVAGPALRRDPVHRLPRVREGVQGVARLPRQPARRRRWTPSPTPWSLDKGDDRYLRRMCMHCATPSCASACPVGAFTKTELGPVVYDGVEVPGLPLLHESPARSACRATSGRRRSPPSASATAASSGRRRASPTPAPRPARPRRRSPARARSCWPRRGSASPRTPAPTTRRSTASTRSAGRTSSSSRRCPSSSSG